MRYIGPRSKRRGQGKGEIPVGRLRKRGKFREYSKFHSKQAEAQGRAIADGASFDWQGNLVNGVTRSGGGSCTPAFERKEVQGEEGGKSLGRPLVFRQGGTVSPWVARFQAGVYLVMGIYERGRSEKRIPLGSMRLGR